MQTLEAEKPVTSESNELKDTYNWYFLQLCFRVSMTIFAVLAAAITIAVIYGNQQEFEPYIYHQFILTDAYSSGVLLPIVDSETRFIQDPRTGVAYAEAVEPVKKP